VMRHPLAYIVLGGMLLLAAASRSTACPFCAQAGKTLLEEVNDADMVMYGSFNNQRSVDGGDVVDFQIESVVKSHDAIKDKKVITLQRYVRDVGKDQRWLAFCTMHKGKIDLYMAQLVSADSGIDKYLTQALQYQDRKKEPAKRLRFFFDYLDNPEPEIANDALKEWSLADYKDYGDLAKDLPADKLTKWLSDPKTPPLRIGLYASLLGHCGKQDHAAEHLALLKKMANDPAERATMGLDGILAGYILLDPKDGWKALSDILSAPKLSFYARNAALRTARFFWDIRTDVISKEQIVTGVCQLLDQSDIADFAINDLTKRDEWGPLEEILALDTKPSHDIAIIHRAILRYALSVPQDKDSKGLAKQFVEKKREKDPDWVRQAEDLLKLERQRK